MSNQILECALAAAYSHTFPNAAKNGGGVITALSKVYPIVNAKASCPDRGCNIPGDVAHIVMHLNDQHKWTREKIADWVGTLEDEQFEKSKKAAEDTAAKMVNEMFETRKPETVCETEKVVVEK